MIPRWQRLAVSKGFSILCRRDNKQVWREKYSPRALGLYKSDLATNQITDRESGQKTKSPFIEVQGLIDKSKLHWKLGQIK